MTCWLLLVVLQLVIRLPYRYNSTALVCGSSRALTRVVTPVCAGAVPCVRGAERACVCSRRGKHHAGLRPLRHTSRGGRVQAGRRMRAVRRITQLPGCAARGVVPAAAPWLTARLAELAQRQVTFASTPDVRPTPASRASGMLTRTQVFLQAYGIEPMLPDGTRVSTLQTDARRERATVRHHDAARRLPFRGALCSVASRALTSRGAQVDEKCISCGHKGLSFHTMQVRTISRVRPACLRRRRDAVPPCSCVPQMKARLCSMTARPASACHPRTPRAAPQLDVRAAARHVWSVNQ